MGYLWTFDCQVYANILDKKQVKRWNPVPVGSRERYFIGYTSKGIYKIYFPNSWQIEIVRDLEFDKGYSYEEIEIIVEKLLLFSFSKLEFFTNSTFNTFVKKEKKLFAISSILSVIFLEAKSDGDWLSPIPSDNNSLFS